MRIEKKLLGAIQTNTYVVINEETKEAFVVDPAANKEAFIQSFEVEGYDLKAILLTHGHYDHVGGVEALIEKYQCPLYALEQEAETLSNPNVNLSYQMRNKISIESYTPLIDGQEIEVAGIKIDVLATPGHTTGGVCYYVAENGVLFSGDTLFAESVGRTDLPGGSYDALVRSINEKLLVLPEDTIVYPGHMSETTIEHEKTYNPYIG